MAKDTKSDDGIRRTTIRYSCAKKDHHRRAYDIVESKSNAIKNEFIIQAILEKEAGSNLADIVKRAIHEEVTGKNLQMNITGIEDLLRKAVREELAHVSFAQEGTQARKENLEPDSEGGAITSDAMDFLKKL